MYAVVLSAAAQTDLDNIVQYIAVDNPTAAEKLGLDLIDEKHRGVLKLIHGNYVITYRIDESNHTVQVLGFTHGARIK